VIDWHGADSGDEQALLSGTTTYAPFPVRTRFYLVRDIAAGLACLNTSNEGEADFNCSLLIVNCSLIKGFRQLVLLLFLRFVFPFFLIYREPAALFLVING
jgi:hypothetical protein